MVKAELLFGARHSKKVEQNLQRLKVFFQPLNSLPFDDKCADEYGLIRSDLSHQGNIIGPNDLLIASIAKAYDAVLVTIIRMSFLVLLVYGWLIGWQSKY